MKGKLFVKEDISDFYKDCFDNLDFVLLIYKGEISLTEELKDPIVSRELCKLSKEHSFILFFHFIALIENKKYLSVMVIDNGRIIGVSDSVTSKEFCNSQRQRIYLTSKLKAGIVVDEDIFHTDSVSSLCQNKADAIIFMTANDFSDNFYQALSCHKFFNDISIIAAFGNKLCIYGKNSVFGICEKEYSFDVLSKSKKGRQTKKLKNPSFEY